MITIVIIDAIKQFREKIAALLAGQDDFKILAQGKDGYDALRLVSCLKPDIIILGNRLELVEEEELPSLLRARSPSTAIVIITARISDYQLYRAASDEVSGVIYKETEMNMLPRILKCISQGGCFISPWLASRILHLFSGIDRKNIAFHGSSSNRLQAKGSARQCPEVKFPGSYGEDPIEHLSKMELRILTHVGEGYTSGEIAGSLGLTVGTVRNYISSAMRKTGLHNRSQMTRFAFEYGLISLNQCS